MQDQNQKTQMNPAAPVAPTKIVAPTANPSGASQVSKPMANSKTKTATKAAPGVVPAGDYERRIIDKIKDSENILVALSRDPSVDEMAAAIGLTMFLDGLQKHTTAIYSGATPDALQFLQPAETFETNTDSLQDFIIALSKDKADHLRYKLDGDFVKVYITPYKTVLSENDLEFSHGDYNVDLVLALGVPQATDLDEALAEYGRIMHDATTVDITCDAPGRFGEIEWSDPGASSVSEMITKLIFAMQGKDAVVDKEIATALLTGIVAATGRFSNDRTNSETMQLASKLMAMGADQQLIAAHVMENDTSVLPSSTPSFADYNAPLPTPDETNLLIGKDYGNYTPTLNETVVPAEVPVAGGIDQAAALAQAQAATNTATVTETPNPVAAAAANAVSEAVATAAANASAAAKEPEKVPEEKPAQNGSKDYAAMMAEALAEPSPASPAAPAPEVLAAPVTDSAPTTTPQPVAKPAGAEQVVLPPPPAPKVDTEMMPPVLPQVQVPEDLAAQQAAEQAKAMADQAAKAAQAEPGAFHIPGTAV